MRKCDCQEAVCDEDPGASLTSSHLIAHHLFCSKNKSFSLLALVPQLILETLAPAAHVLLSQPCNLTGAKKHDRQRLAAASASVTQPWLCCLVTHDLGLHVPGHVGLLHLVDTAAEDVVTPRRDMALRLLHNLVHKDQIRPASLDNLKTLRTIFLYNLVHKHQISAAHTAANEARAGKFLRACNDLQLALPMPDGWSER